MPTYEYQCTACGHAFEKFHSITASPIKVCPQCGKKKVKRLIGTGAGVIFKGSGFYATDYRSDSYKSAAKSDTAGSSTPAKSDAPSSSSSGGSSPTPATPSKPEKASTTKAAASPSK